MWRLKALLAILLGGGRVRRVAAVAVLAGMGTFLVAAPASAATPAALPAVVDDCKTGPVPESPQDGFAASLMPVRDGRPQGANATQFEQYGFAGLNWESYNLGISAPVIGCIPNADAVDASTANSIANMILGAATGLAAFANSISHTAYDLTWTSVFDPFLQRATDSLRANVFSVFVPFAFTVLGFLILWHARKSQLSSTAAMVGGGLLVTVAATMIFAWPLVVVHTADTVTAGAIGTVTDAINNDKAPGSGDTPRTADQSLMNSMYDNLLFRSWVSGTFGNPDSPTAKKYAKDLFEAQTLSWNEAPLAATPVKLCDDPAEITAKIPCPGSPTSLIETKQKAYVAIADKIEQEDPVAYANLQGRNGRDRIWYALLCLVAVILTLPVVLIGSLAMVTAVLISRFVLILVPVIFPVAVVKPTLAMDAWDRVATIAITSIIWGIGIPILTLLDAAVFQSALAPPVQLLLLLGLAIAALATLFGFAPGFSGAMRKRHAKKGYGFAQSLLGKMATGAATGAAAGAVAGRVARGGQPAEVDTPAPPDGTYSATYSAVNKGNRPDPDPAALPAATSPEPIDAEILPDALTEDEIIDVEEVTPGRELPSAVYRPDRIFTADDLDERALPDEPDAKEVGRLGDEAPVAPVREEGDREPVFEIYSGEADWVEPADLSADDTYMGESPGDVPALPAAGESGGAA